MSALEKKAINLDDLYIRVQGESVDVSYVNYWIEPEENFVSRYIRDFEINTKNVAKECINCQITTVEKYKALFPDKPSVSAAKQEKDHFLMASHPFQVSCNFIPKDYDYKLTLDERLMAGIDESQIKLITDIKDPVRFASKSFQWKARKHQEVAFRCQAKRKVLRWGRRSGKTDFMAVEALWYVFTKAVTRRNPETGKIEKEPLKILLAAPFESQIIAFFEKILGFLERDEEVKDSLLRYVKTPHHHMEFKNGAIIKGFTTGQNNAASIRGQGAHVLILDEADYMSPGDYATILPIMQDNPNVLVRGASTPKGKREKFWEWCQQNPGWKEFYFPSAVIEMTPEKESGLSWKQMRAEMRPEHTQDSWLQEVLAYFISSADGVYQPKFVGAAMADYTYKEMRDLFLAGKLIGWRYSMGVDWNSNVGTEIAIIGYAPNSGFTVMDMVNVPKQDFTQYKGMTEIINLASMWKPDYIYVDSGHGATNVETLQIWASRQAPGSYERSLETRIKKYEFGGKVEIRDPITKVLKGFPAKPYMVENSVRKFEDGVIRYSKDDEKLMKQLLNYIIRSRSVSGTPIYDVENKVIGDHALDALNLALVAWALEESPMARDPVNPEVSVGVFAGREHTILESIKRSTETSVGLSLKEKSEDRIYSIHSRNKRIYNEREVRYEMTAQQFLSDQEHVFKAQVDQAKKRSLRNRIISRTRGL